MRTRTGRAVVACAVLVLLAGACEARLTIAVTADRDGAGELSLALGADAALLAEAAAAGVDPLGELAATGARLQEGESGWRLTDTAQDGGRTVVLTAPFATPEDLGGLADEVAEAMAGPELAPLEGLRLEVEDDVLRMTGGAGLVPTDAVTELGVQPEQAVQILEDTQALRYEVHLDLAGAVLETNGQVTAEGEPIVWRIPPGEQVAMVAVTERPRTAWGPLVAAGLLVLAGTATWWWVRGRRRASGPAPVTEARG